MKFSIAKNRDVRVVVFENNLEGGWDTFALKDAVSDRLSKGDRRFLIDMKNSSFVNSTGIGVLLALHTSIHRANGRLKLCQITDKARKSFFVTGPSLWETFEVHPSREEALQAFGLGADDASTKDRLPEDDP